MLENNQSSVLPSIGWKRRLTVSATALALLFPLTGFCSRDVGSLVGSSRFTENFDANNYQDLVWVTNNGVPNGAIHEWVSNGGWNGTGAAKFYPPTVSQSYCALGQLTNINGSAGTEQLNVRFLIYHGSEWNRVRDKTKTIVMNRAEHWPRPMVAEWAEDAAVPRGERTYFPADNTVGIFENGTPWPDGTESFLIGDQPGARLEEWISVEMEANVRTGLIRLYITTQDGEHTGLFLEKNMEEVPNPDKVPGVTSPIGPGTPLLHYIDVIGGYFNDGAPHNANTYFMIDELVIDDSYIGPPAGFVGGTNPTPTPEPEPEPEPLPRNSYTILNYGLVSAAVISMVDNNTITAAGKTLHLDRYETGVFSSADGSRLSLGKVVSGTGPFEIGSNSDATDVPAHQSLAGRQFVMPQGRGEQTHQYFMVSQEGDANVTVSLAGIEYSVALQQGIPKYFDGGTNNHISAVITSDNPILVSHRGRFLSRPLSTDSSPMPPAANELWGFRSKYATFGAVEDDTDVIIYASDGSTRTTTLHAGQKRYVNIGDQSPQGMGSAIHLVADKPIAAVQIADGDGRDQTAFFPTALLKRRFALPREAQYVAIACPEEGTTVTLYNGNNPPEVQACNANGNHPGKAYFGSRKDGAHIQFGAYLESNNPIHVIYENARSNDEHNMIGTNVASTTGGTSVTPLFSADMEGASPASDWLDARTVEAGGGGTITFPSDGNSQVAQFNYQPGHSNEVWLRHNFGAYPNINEEPVNELWLNVEYQINDTSIYNPNPGQASKILYFNWSSPTDRTRTSQVVLGAIDNGNGHRFRLSKEVFNANGSWAPGGEWLTDYAVDPIPENEKLYLQLHIRNSTNGAANGFVELYNNGRLIFERRNILLNDNPTHSPNQLVLTSQISHTPPGSGGNGYARYDNVSLYDTDPGPFTGP